MSSERTNPFSESNSIFFLISVFPAKTSPPRAKIFPLAAGIEMCLILFSSDKLL